MVNNFTICSCNFSFTLSYLLWVPTSCYDIGCTVISLFGNNVMLMWCTLGSYFADTEVSKKCGFSTTVSSAFWRDCFVAFSACRSVNSFDYKLEFQPDPVYVYWCALEGILFSKLIYSLAFLYSTCWLRTSTVNFRRKKFLQVCS